MMGIIDSHVHIGEKGVFIDKGENASLQRLLFEMESNKVEKAILVALEDFSPNNFVEKIYKKYKDKFWFFCSANPLKTSSDAFIEYFRKSEASGIKVHPRLQGFSLKDSKVIDFFKAVESKTGTILLIDCWFSDNDPDDLIVDLANFINNFAKFRIILAHSGGFKYKRIIEFAKKDNVYLDLSYVLNTFKKHKKYELMDDFMENIRKINSSKLIFGSDFPEYDVKNCISLLTSLLDKHKFTKEEADRIFSKNIYNLIKSGGSYG